MRKGKKSPAAVGMDFGVLGKMKKSLFWEIARAVANALLWALTGIFSLVKTAVLSAFDFLWNAASKARAGMNKPNVKAEYAAFSEVKAIKGNAGELEKALYSSKSLIGIILGGRGSGKTALGLRMLENAKARGRSVQALGFSEESLPPWMQCVSTLEQVKNGAFLLVDEGGIVFSARSAFASPNKLLSDLLLISRHKDLSVLFISQNSANLDVNALRQADYLLLKRPSLLQKDFERKIIGKIYEENRRGFEGYAQMPGLFLAYSDEFLGFAQNGLPSFWSEKASKAFKNYPLK
ncbi:MAG: hypothetical protein WC792_00710 [Candidatus Micrarchaeia archaeon]|jgi:hypothetical protein